MKIEFEKTNYGYILADLHWRMPTRSTCKEYLENRFSSIRFVENTIFVEFKFNDCGDEAAFLLWTSDVTQTVELEL